MLNKLITILFLLLSSTFVHSEQVSDERLQNLVDAWDMLVAQDAYDFMPEKLNYELMNDPEFQKKINEAGAKINKSIDGKEIELAGFMVPVEIKGSNVSQFLLVPEAGQCIHVPPPPLSQTVLVDMKQNPTKLRDIYIPVIVSGKISVGVQSNDISTGSTNDSNPNDIFGAQSYNTVDSGYTLTEITKIDVLTYSNSDEF